MTYSYENQAAKFITLAESIITDYKNDISHISDNLTELKHLRKLECTYNKTNGIDFIDFCIGMSAIPARHYRLMKILNWLDKETDMPVAGVKGFYSDYMSGHGVTEIHHFISVTKYVKLLFIELEINNLYELKAS